MTPPVVVWPVPPHMLFDVVHQSQQCDLYVKFCAQLKRRLTSAQKSLIMAVFLQLPTSESYPQEHAHPYEYRRGEAVVSYNGVTPFWRSNFNANEILQCTAASHRALVCTGQANIFLIFLLTIIPVDPNQNCTHISPHSPEDLGRSAVPGQAQGRLLRGSSAWQRACDCAPLSAGRGTWRTGGVERCETSASNRTASMCPAWTLE